MTKDRGVERRPSSSGTTGTIREDTHPEDHVLFSTLPEPFASYLGKALDKDATDLHIDPGKDQWLVRMRLHGHLAPAETVPLAIGTRLANQAKVAAELRLDKPFLAEEGRLWMRRDAQEYDLRVSVVPTLKGEAVHLRILSAKWTWENLGDLGFSEQDIGMISETVNSQTGLVLIAGATGGGKTTTLYALTTILDATSNVIASIEDPVEYTMPGVRQIQVDPEHGLTMAEGLRVLLRMDPDIILVGEIRDAQSASIAGRASLTGALVAATIHAPDPLGAIASLQNLSVPRHVIGGALRMIITQELLPTLCRQCVAPRSIKQREQDLFRQHGVAAPEAVMEATGCPACHGSGCSGQTAVAEVVPVNRTASGLIVSGSSRAALNACFKDERLGTLSKNALLKAARGEISMLAVERLVLARRGSPGQGSLA